MNQRLFSLSYCCLLLANFLLYFGFWILIPILPFYIKDTYHLPAGEIGLILSIYTVSALIIRPFSGYLLDKFNRKPLYILSYSLFTLTFAAYILESQLYIFIILRIIHGLTFGMVTIGSNTIVIDILPAEHRGEGLGYYGLTNNLALCIAPMVGLFAHSSYSYESIFFTAFLTCFLGLVLALIVHIPVKDLKIKQRIPLSLDRFFLLKSIPASFSLILLSIPYGAVTNFVAIYITDLNISVTSGFFFVLMAIGMGSSRIFSGKYVDKGYITQCIKYGLYVIAVSFLLLASCYWLTPYNKQLVHILLFGVPLLLGLGFGIIFPAFNTLYIDLGKHNQRATAVSSYLTSWDIGLGLGLAISGAIAQISHFGYVYLLGGCLSIVSTIFFIRKVTPHYYRNKVDN